MMFNKSFLLSLICFLGLNILTAQQEITLEDIWKNYTFYPNYVPGFNFMNDGTSYSKIEENKIVKYDLITGNKIEDIWDAEAFKDQKGFSGNISSYTFNADESKIVIESEIESIYRRSYKAKYHIYDIASGSFNSTFKDGKIQYCTLSPNGKMVAYVWENNIYYMDIETGTTTAITSDGLYNNIINGSADWVYEEEFAFAKAFFWSPDSKKIAYMRFDESQVKEFTMTNYRDNVYPEYVTFKYPKVGEKNAVVTAQIYHLENNIIQPVDLGENEDIYIPRLKWTKDPNSLCVFKMNRHQNNLQLILVNAGSAETKILLEEKNQYYIDITDDLSFTQDGKHFIWSSEKSGFNHIYLYDMNGNEVSQLTKGDYDVTSFYGLDEKNERIYYQAAETSPLKREIYSCNLEGKKKKKLSEKEGTSSAQFSSTFDYFVNTYSNINQASEYAVFDNKGKSVRVIEDNTKMKQLANDFNAVDAEFFSFKTSENITLNGYSIKPPNFDPSKKYPVFMYVYGGPGSQTVQDAYRGSNYWWFQMLAQKGYIVVSVDNRGTGARGEEFKKLTYLQLGHFETIDQIEAAQYMASLPYVDASRIGIFGWSYGGYMSSLCLLKGADVFKAAIAVAPVTSWKWYDTIYTERYMRTLAENEDGYKENSPVYFADLLKGSYLLVHGNADDNVHFQNTAEMANALIKANKQFDTYFYPNRNHGIYGDNARLHLYTKMTNFILEKL